MAERTGPLRRGPALAEPGAPGRDPWPASARRSGRRPADRGRAPTTWPTRFGTPLLVFDEDDLRARCRAARRAFPTRPLRREGVHGARRAPDRRWTRASTCSPRRGGEVEACLRAGRARRPRRRCTGNNKSDDELALAVRRRVSLVIVDGPRRAAAARRDRARGRAACSRSCCASIPERAGPTRTRRSPPATRRRSSGPPLAEAVARSRRRAALAGRPVRRSARAHRLAGARRRTPYLRERSTRCVGLAARLRDEAGDRGRACWTWVVGSRSRTLDEHGAGHRRASPPRCRARLRVAVRARRVSRVPALVGEPGRSLVANPVITPLPGRAPAKRAATGAPLVGRRRRHVRQPPADAVRRPLHRGARRRRRGGPLAGVASRSSGKHCESGDVLAEDVDAAGRPRARRPAGVRGDRRVHVLAREHVQPRRAVPRSSAVRAGRATAVAPARGRRRSRPARGRAPRPAPDADAAADGVTIRPAAPADARSFLDVLDGDRRPRAGTCAARRVAHPAARLPRAASVGPWTDREAQIVAVDGGPRRGPPLHPARVASRHAARRDARDRGGRRPPRHGGRHAR